MSWAAHRRPAPGNWKTLKAAVLRLHGYTCHLCGHGGADEVDHRLNVARGGNHDPDNLAPIHGSACPICGRHCHTEKTQTEAAAGRAQVGRRRQPERHPGLIG